MHKRMPLSEGVVLATACSNAPTTASAMTGGQLRAHPVAARSSIPSRAKLRPFPIVEQIGLAWVWLGDPAQSRSAVPPPTPELAGGEWTTHMFDPAGRGAAERRADGQDRRASGDYRQPPFMADWFGYPIVDRWHTHHMMGPGRACAPADDVLGMKDLNSLYLGNVANHF